MKAIQPHKISFYMYPTKGFSCIKVTTIHERLTDRAMTAKAGLTQVKSQSKE
jgi:hypothetical protein